MADVRLEWRRQRSTFMQKSFRNIVSCHNRVCRQSQKKTSMTSEVRRPAIVIFCFLTQITLTKGSQCGFLCNASIQKNSLFGSTKKIIRNFLNLWLSVLAGCGQVVADPVATKVFRLDLRAALAYTQPTVLSRCILRCYQWSLDHGKTLSINRKKCDVWQ